MTSIIQRRQKSRLAPRQPLDRHLSEVGEFDGTIYINAGIDSTCSKKRSRTIHKLTDGIMISTTEMRSSNVQNDNLSAILLNSRTDDDRLDVIKNGCCVHCGRDNTIVKDN
ncbi:unnamed protein product [Rotaria sp. Silwood1]|nr:unnamed protein product [Rotaria sp. Silwood1]CAF1369874.1 unnamed protein product [Rotaria sp. Silwood1]CAF1381956.1 unnamed protein product [Rotaria sp. Silwood1]CAF3497934.1 unnamed protein product [Rotaria sp. Silwood1]CAF3601016.1 unnamed protein product [Rotaria sp. Silwood1]